MPEGLEGISRLHVLVAEHAPAEWADVPPEQVAARVVVRIETDRGPWVAALVAAGYKVCAINKPAVRGALTSSTRPGGETPPGLLTARLTSQRHDGSVPTGIVAHQTAERWLPAAAISRQVSPALLNAATRRPTR